MLKIEKLNQYYGQSHTLWDLTLDVPEGECTVLMGRNGVGKTTLLKCIMGLLPVKGGILEYQGTNLKKVSAEQRAPLGIGYVPQGRQIFPFAGQKSAAASKPRARGTQQHQDVFQ